jgi:hypothetical protein
MNRHISLKRVVLAIVLLWLIICVTAFMLWRSGDQEGRTLPVPAQSS